MCVCECTIGINLIIPGRTGKSWPFAYARSVYVCCGRQNRVQSHGKLRGDCITDRVENGSFRWRHLAMWWHPPADDDRLQMQIVPDARGPDQLAALVGLLLEGYVCFICCCVVYCTAGVIGRAPCLTPVRRCASVGQQHLESSMVSKRPKMTSSLSHCVV